MFTGIIECTGIVNEVITRGSNKIFWIGSSISPGLKKDQSLSHSGVCLTVEETRKDSHRVTAVAETLQKTNLDTWKPGTVVNLERGLRPTDRLDGHFVQGHVDTTGICRKKTEKNGSWEFRFEFPKSFAQLVIEKGSIAINGVSLTTFDVKKKSFSIIVIPYTFENTGLSLLNEGDMVNIEFDMVGKYIKRQFSL